MLIVIRLIQTPKSWGNIYIYSNSVFTFAYFDVVRLFRGPLG